MIYKPILLLIIFLRISVFTQTSLPSFFSDGMVLQQNENAAIWGTDNANVTVSLSASWGEEISTRSDNSGKWKTTINTPSAGGPYTLNITGSEDVKLDNILIGEVWICSGQSNMEMPVKGYNSQPIIGSNEAILNSRNNQIRLFDTKRNTSLTPLDNITGEWQEAKPSTVGNFSATAYYFGKKLSDILDVPIGLIHTSWGGSKAEAWMDAQSLSVFEEITLPDEIPERQKQHTPTLLYNAMLHPFVGYQIKGVIWYQGESNRLKPKQYTSLFPAMIELWRNKWQQGNFPFYFAQIAPFDYSQRPDDGNSAFLREAQLYAMQTVENTGMAVTMDIGECNNIHPGDKEKVGNRLAYWALAKDYGFDGIAYSGPVYREMEVTDGKEIELLFDHAPNGFSSFGQKLSGFEIAGEDKVFHPAEAKINRDKTITVWSEHVVEPVAVRYAFENCVNGTLFNTEGLPASSFRTDDWEVSE